MLRTRLSCHCGDNIRVEILHWLGRDEKELTIPLFYTLLSNAALMVAEGTWLRVLYGWSAGNPQRSPSALYSSGTAAGKAQCTGVEEKQNFFSGDLSVLFRRSIC